MFMPARTVHGSKQTASHPFGKTYQIDFVPMVHYYFGPKPLSDLFPSPSPDIQVPSSQ